MMNNRHGVDTLMKANTEWLAEISSQLALRKIFVVVLTPNALKSPSVCEVLKFKWHGHVKISR